MKRDHQNNLIRAEGGGDLYSTTTCSATATNGKAKMSWEQQTTNPTKEEQHEVDALLQDAGEDELLAVLGYKVKSSDMAEVAQKLEQLEMMMGNAQDDNLLLSHLSSDTAHYNPSDLSTWLESMLSEVNPVVPQSQSAVSNDPFLAAAESSTITTVDFPRSSLQPQIYDESTSSDYDLRAIPAGAMVYGERETKRIKHHQETSSVSSSSIGVVSLPPPPQQQQSTESTRSVVLMDPQETGIRLVHTLMACAEAVQRENLKLAEALVKQIGLLAVSQAGAMGKVATYFAEALARRIYQFYPQPSLDSSFSDILQMHFYETCPYLKFAHFTANQAILEALATKPRIHIIDFSMKQGMQWPALMQALAIRPGGPPSLRLTGIGPPQPDNTDALQHVGWRLADFADKLHIEFEYRGFVTNSLADLDASMLDIGGSEMEVVAVNSVFELHQMLALPGAIDKVLGSIKKMKPKIVTIVEQEANHNGPLFLDRFTEALHYYSTLFDSLEGYGGTPMGALNSQDLVMSEMYLGRQICNVVACEGVDRVERHESLTQWRGRLGSAGFAPAHLGSNAFKQAGTLLAALFGGGTGYRVEEHNGCLMLGWHTRPIIASSAWQLRSNSPTR